MRVWEYEGVEDAARRVTNAVLGHRSGVDDQESGQLGCLSRRVPRNSWPGWKAGHKAGTPRRHAVIHSHERDEPRSVRQAVRGVDRRGLGLHTAPRRAARRPWRRDRRRARASLSSPSVIGMNFVPWRRTSTNSQRSIPAGGSQCGWARASDVVSRRTMQSLRLQFHRSMATAPSSPPTPMVALWSQFTRTPASIVECRLTARQR